MNGGSQLPLAMRWPAQQRFEDYVAGENVVALDLVRRAAAGETQDWVFLAGPAASGKTHLLFAACALASARGLGAQYVSLRGVLAAEGAEQAIRAFGGSDLLAIDDVDAIAGDRAAEHALFDLYNRCRGERATLLFAAMAPAAQGGFCLPDLVSRLSACAQGTLRPLDDDARREVVRARAHARGIALDDEALAWMFTHMPRDLSNLLRFVERIDRASLAAKRRVTVPFLRAFVAGLDS